MDNMTAEFRQHVQPFRYAMRTVGKPKMEEKKGYRIVPMTTQDTTKVITFLRSYFFLDEPLNIAVGLLDEPGSVCHELEQYCKESITDGVSLMAFSPSDELIGVSICGIMRRSEGEVKDEALNECRNKKFERILRLLTRANTDCDMFSRYPGVDEILEIRIVSVSEKARGQGIAKAFFLEGAKATAKEKGIPLIKVDCSSHFSGLIAAKLGFECIYQLNYSDFVDEDGNPYLEPPNPHRTLKTYILWVEEPIF